MKRVPSLDGLRAVSVLMIIVTHVFSHATAHNGVETVLLGLTSAARSGVSVFFVISGFLITLLLIKEKQASGQISLSAFYFRRAFRILPAFLLYIGCIAILVRLGVIYVPGWLFVKALTFTMDYVSVENWFVHHIWSLSVEEQFYLLWPLLVFFCSRKTLTRIALGVIVLEPFIRMADRIFFPSTRFQITYMAHTRADMLMFGCIVALLYENGAFQRYVAMAFRYQVPAVAAIFFFVISPLCELKWEGHYLLPVGFTLQGICITVLMLYAIERWDGRVGRFLNSPAVVWVGVLSYSLYLWQELFVGFGSTETNAVGLLFVVPAAAGSYYLVEKPMLKVKGHFERRRAGLKTPIGEHVTPADAA
jgi:peptidoglycan/LPS O-acetylase OafA/YrhL